MTTDERKKSQIGNVVWLREFEHRNPVHQSHPWMTLRALISYNFCLNFCA
jgi:hypothetical protein